MNSLANYIYGKGWKDETEVKTGLNVQVTTKTDSTLYTQKHLPNVLTDQELGIAATVLKQASDADPVIWLFVQSFSTGIDFSSDVSVKFLTALFSGFPDLLTKLISIGKTFSSEWETQFEKFPEDTEIQAALIQVENVRWIEDILLPKVAQLRESGGDLQTTKDEIKTLIA